ncbi:MAG TPA: zf-HC2 domain-containing protein [Candidatus Polarisedimenticolia bacterium]|nr:zf-HC2 domain-containing protein [Candidatus Polarisedimenticolia bacterium]
MNERDRCRETRELLAAFHDDELPCELSRAVQTHIDRCGGCRGFSEMERSFTAVMRSRLGTLEAPQGMYDRIAPLLGGPEGPGGPAGWSWLRRSTLGLAAVAASLLVAAPALRVYAPATYGSVARWVAGEGRLSGVLVCVECDQEGVSLDAQRRCHAPGHQTGVRCPGKVRWHLVANETTLPVMRDRDRRGEHVVLEGRLLSDIRYVDARAIRPGGGT